MTFDPSYTLNTKETHMVLPALGLLIAVIGVVVGFVIGYRCHANSVRADLKTLRFYRKNYLRRQGGTVLVPGADNYEIASFDGGRNWYAVKDTTLEVTTEPDGSCSRNYDYQIVGPAEVIYPGLVEHLCGMDALVAQVKEHGALTLGGTGFSSEVKLLEQAGFTVKKA